MKRLEEAAPVLKDGPSMNTVREQRARLVAAARPSRARWWALGVVVTAIALALISWKATRPVVTTVTVGALAAGQLRLPDGSVLSIDPDSVARLSRFDDSNVEVLLERGRLTAWVQKGTGRTWRYVAGPWTVRVLGTTLHIAHDPDSRRIEVSVDEGVVELSGPGGTTLIRAGEVVRRSDAVVEEAVVAPAPVQGPLVKLDAPKPVAPRLVRVTPEPPPVAEDESPPPAPHVLTWQELLEAGRRKEALDRWEANVQPAGITDAQLLRLADAARLEHRLPLARSLLDEVESRHGSGAAEAAYLLGRFEVEAHGLLAARLRFSASVLQEPNGPFAEQSRGRLIEVLLELDQQKEARAAARDYLEHHPRGAWSGLATRLIGDAGR